MNDVDAAELFCRPDGRIEAIYTESIALSPLGIQRIRRASHVEPDDTGRWWADMTPSGGARLGPFPRRSAALRAERQWLTCWLVSHVPHAAEVAPDCP